MYTARFTALVLVILGCGRGEPGAMDAAVRDAARDPRVVDTIVSDAASDPRAIDGRVPDAAPGPPADAAPPDSSPDVAPPDAGGFAGCPGPEAYVGDRAWRSRLELAPPGYQRCAYWVGSSGTIDPLSTSNSLKASWAAKRIATVPPGTYPLIDEQARAPFALPLCLRARDGKTATPGTGTIVRRTYAGDPVFDFFLPVPGQGVVVASTLAQPGNPAVVRDIGSVSLCEDATCPPGKIVLFVPCQIAGLTPAQHRVSFDGGQVELTVAIDKTSAGLGTEAGEFNRATGSFKGVAFDQTDYFQLIYSPEHHHFVRHFAVLFDAPIDGACGLEIVNLAAGPLRRPPGAFTVDCQLNRLSELKVTSVMF